MNEIAEIFNISESTLYRYLNFLRSKELVYDHSDNLVLKSIKQLGNHHKKTTLIINEGLSLFDVSCLLYAKVIEKKARQMSYRESLRRYGRGDSCNNGACEIPFYPSMSLRIMAKLLNFSEFKAFLVEKRLNDLGVIRTHKPKPVFIVDNFTDTECISDYPGKRFVVAGKLFEKFSQKLEFLQFPMFLKSFSYKQLIKLKKYIRY